MAHTLSGPSEEGEPAAQPRRQAAAVEQDPPSLTDGDNKSAAAALRARLMGESVAAGGSGNRGPEAKRKQVACRITPGMLASDLPSLGHVECALAWHQQPRYRTGLRQQRRPCDRTVASNRMAYNDTAVRATAVVYLAQMPDESQPLQASACSPILPL